MAEGDGIIYNEIKEELPKGAIDFINHDIKVALFSAGYVPDIDADVNYSLLGNECSGAGYVAGGVSVTTKTVTRDDANDRTLLNCDDILWTDLGTLTPQPAWAVMYDNSHATKCVMTYWELTKPTNGGNYILTIASAPDAAIIIS